ncbi:hypothetical protein K443DRAFT_116985, partial [Laccaria amethystina LaAM-08-1]
GDGPSWPLINPDGGPHRHKWSSVNPSSGPLWPFIDGGHGLLVCTRLCLSMVVLGTHGRLWAVIAIPRMW